MSNKKTGRKFPPCHVDSYYGRDMHTRKVNCYGDESKWVYEGCDESLVEEKSRYKVWLKTRCASDPADASTLTTVYHFEKVPEEILEMERKVKEYWESDKPSNL